MKPSFWDPAPIPGGSGGCTPASKVRRLTAAEIAAEYGERAHRPAPVKKPTPVAFWNFNRRKGATR
jgi:hypothetical protein